MNINDNNIHRSVAGGTIRKMKRYMNSFKIEGFIHINREENREAHDLDRIAVKNTNGPWPKFYVS